MVLFGTDYFRHHQMLSALFPGLATTAATDSSSVSKPSTGDGKSVLLECETGPISFAIGDLVARLEMYQSKAGSMCQDLPVIAAMVFAGLKNHNSSHDLEQLIVSVCSNRMLESSEYEKLAVWVMVNRIHRETSASFLELAERSKVCNRNKQNEVVPLFTTAFTDFLVEHYQRLDAMVDYQRDFDFDILGIRTTCKSYLKIENNGRYLERPQQLFMRVAIAIHGLDPLRPLNEENWAEIRETYDLISLKWMIHATPTLANAGTLMGQLASCFMVTMDDSLDSIMECAKQSARISGSGGGLGIYFGDLRASGSTIHSTQGESGGLKVLKLFEQVTKYANQGGRRAGASAPSIPDWHGDLVYFTELTLHTGKPEDRAPSLNTQLMVSDLFMKRIASNQMWSLMCPNACPLLCNAWGPEFERIYQEYEREGKYLKQMPARDLWNGILESQISAGKMYIMFKDHINKTSNQIQDGVTKMSNLCCEITQVSSSSEYTVCILGSICLKSMVDQTGVLWNRIMKTAQVLTRNLYKIIDLNHYPTALAEKGSLRHRAIGVGIQGLANMMGSLRIPFLSDEAFVINAHVAEAIYYGCLTASMELAKQHGPYQGFAGSPLSQGKFQFDLWGLDRSKLSGRWNWSGLMDKIQIYGVGTSLTTAYMPTSTSSNPMGNTECFEPFQQHIMVRGTGVGEQYLLNPYLREDLIKEGLWDRTMIAKIAKNSGSVRGIDGIPQHIVDLYPTIWEMDSNKLIDLCAVRGPFIDQSQSMSLYLNKPDKSALSAMLFRAWQRGLKTGKYYTHFKPKANSTAIDIDLSLQDNAIRQQEAISGSEPEEGTFCTREMIEAGCTSCAC